MKLEDLHLREAIPYDHYLPIRLDHHATRGQTAVAIYTLRLT
jgi:hypothetical protein